MTSKLPKVGDGQDPIEVNVGKKPKEPVADVSKSKAEEFIENAIEEIQSGDVTVTTKMTVRKLESVLVLLRVKRD